MDGARPNAPGADVLRAAIHHATRALEAAGRLAQPFPPDLYRLRGQAYEQLGDFVQASVEPMQKLVDKSPDRMQYTIQPLNPALAPFDVVCVLPKKIGSAPQDTWMPGNLGLPLPGKMQWEYRIDAAGGMGDAQGFHRRLRSHRERLEGGLRRKPVAGVLQCP